MQRLITKTLAPWIMLLGCTGSSKETSVEFGAPKLPTLLKAIQPLIQKGFEDAQIGQAQAVFQSLAVNETRRLNFPIVYSGVDTVLRLQIRKEDVDTVELRFFSTPPLVDKIQATIRATPLDMPWTPPTR